MATRRDHGDGSIYQDARGRWIAQISLGRGPDGRRIRRKRVARTKNDAKAFLQQLQRDHDDGLALSGASVTVADLLDRVVTIAENRGRRPKTIENYQWAVGHLMTGLGHHKARDLTPFQIEDFLDRVRADRGLSRSSLVRLRGVLLAAIREGERQGWLTRNAAALAHVPDSHTTTRTALTLEQTRTLIDTARGTRLEAAVTVGLTCALRPGELLGLTWLDLELDGDTPRLHVRHSLKHDTSGTYLGDVKTHTSRRTLHLSTTATNALRRHRRAQNEYRLELGTHWSDHDLVFPDDRGGPRDPHNFRRAFRRLTTDAGLGPLPPYTLRHTAITLLSQNEVPAELLADLAGTPRYADTPGRVPSPHRPTGRHRSS